MEELGRKLRLAYYEASDGPRLMLFGPLDVDLRSLQDLFRQLSLMPGQSLELHDRSSVVAFGGVRLALSCSGSMLQCSRTTRGGLRRVTGQSGPVFEWARTAEGWDYLAELLDGLIKAKTAGHQYMTSYPSEDAIVVVSKGEYGDEVIRDTEK